MAGGVFENYDFDFLPTNEELESGEIDWSKIITEATNLLQANPQGGPDLTVALVDSGLTMGMNALLPGSGTLFQALGGLDFILNWGSSANPEFEKNLVQTELYDYVDGLLKSMNSDNIKWTLDHIDFRCNWFIAHYIDNRKFHANAPNTKKLMENMKKVCVAFYGKTIGGIVTKLANQGIAVTPTKVNLRFENMQHDWYYYVYTVSKVKPKQGSGQSQSNQGGSKPLQNNQANSTGNVGESILKGLIVTLLLKRFF